MLIPTIEIRPVTAGGELDAAVLRVVDADWIVVASANGVQATLDAAARLGADLSRARWAAIGATTAAALAARGVAAAFVPSAADGDTLAGELPIEPGDRVLLPQADLADDRLAAALATREARVEAVIAYHTDLAPESSRERLRALFAAGGPEAIVFTSGSTVSGLVGLLGSAHLRLARGTVACCIGEATAAAARSAGFDRVTVAAGATPTDLADLLNRTLTPAAPDRAAAHTPEDPS